MQIDLQHRPSQAMAHVVLGPGESVMAESGAMVGMTPNVQIQTGSGGLMKGLKRLFGGESFFRNTFTAEGAPGEVYLAATLPGDLVVLDVGPRSYYLQSHAFVASSTTVDVDTKVGGFKTFFAGEGVFVLRTRGQGKLIAGAFGAIEQVDVRGEYVVDTGHLVAWEDSLQFKITKAADGWIASWLSGEGLVCHFSGHGTLWMQTRNPGEYGEEIGRRLPPRES
ncbi:MAG TPA: TIGR00266 family protein [Myxococcales bacterium]|nr:TIGR00266 family protein [Myxococcales bacterium]